MSQETLSPVFLREVDRGSQEALSRIKRNYEDSSDSLNNYVYHTSKHGLDVARRAVMILNAIRSVDQSLVSQREIYIAYLTGIYHDCVQNWSREEVLEDGIVKVMRRRPSPQNEIDSAQLEIDFMESANRRHDFEVFTTLDKDQGYEGVLATVPQYDEKFKTVIQPNVTPKSSFIARAVALADINGSIMDGAKIAEQDLDGLFIERNLDITDALINHGHASLEHWDFFQKRALNWMGEQIDFIDGRNRLLDQEIGAFPRSAQYNVRREFSRYSESRGALVCLAEKRRNMDPVSLLENIFRRKFNHPN